MPQIVAISSAGEVGTGWQTGMGGMLHYQVSDRLCDACVVSSPGWLVH